MRIASWVQIPPHAPPLIVAQLAEQWTVNPFVAGSSPANENNLLFYTIMSTIGQSVATDLSSVVFYKSPVFYIFILYIALLVAMNEILSGSFKRNYIFSRKFMNEEGDILWGKIMVYPHGFSTVPNIIKSIFTGPITLYLILFTLFLASFVTMSDQSYSPYFYGLMFNYLILFLLFLMHSIIGNRIIDPSTIENVYDTDKDKDKEAKTYDSLYRTQWYLLLWLSPIYSFILTYISRKL